jgi:hypothetical protein
MKAGVPVLKIEVHKKGKVSPADFRLLVVDRETRVAEKLSNLKLDGFSVIESSLSRCVFEDIRARSTCFGEGLQQSVLEDCVFRRCHLVFGTVGNVRLVRCQFESCRLENVIGTKLELIECAFPDTTIKKGVFHGRVEASAQVRPRRTLNEIRDNDFSQADLQDVDFRGGVDLTKQKLPTSDEYLFVRDTCKALEIVKDLQSSIVEKDELKRSQMLAGLLDFYCSRGQRTQLLRVAFWGAFGRELISRLS